MRSRPTWVRLIYGMEKQQWRIWRQQSKKDYMLRSIGKQSGESVSQSGRRKGRLRWEEFAEKESFEPGVEEWRGNEWWKWWVDGSDGGSVTGRTGWCKIGEISAWLTKGSRELVPETRGSILKERSVIRREDDVDERASVTKDKERVLRGGWTVMRLCRYEGWVVVRTL